MNADNNLPVWHISCLTALPAAAFAGGRKGPGGGGPSRREVPAWRRVRRRLWWLLLRIVATVAAWLPPSVGRAAGMALARLALVVRPRERRLALANLELALPEQDGDVRRRLLDEAAAAAGRNLYDALAAGRLLARGGAVRDEAGPDGRTLLAVLADESARGRGVLVLSGHLGCWELFGAWLASELAAAGRGPLHVITGVVRNPAVDRWLAGRRRGLGLVPLPRTAGVAPLLRCLRDGGVLAALVDQNTGVDSRPVPFFGRPAPTPSGPARLAVRLDVPVVVATIAREPGGSGHVVTHGPVWRAPAGLEADAAVDDCLREVNRQLEERVRRNPAEWVWYHRRWDGPREAGNAVNAGSDAAATTTGAGRGADAR